jgi:hypothetical protein
MKTFNDICNEIDWLSMYKARITIKKLSKDNHKLKFLCKFLDDIADSAVEVHGIKESTVYPTIKNVRLIKNLSKN